MVSDMGGPIEPSRLCNLRCPRQYAVVVETDRPARWPLTGTLSVEFVDAADPGDASEPPNFGTMGFRCDPQEWWNDPRLPELLRWLADWVEADQK